MYDPSERATIASELTDAFLASPWSVDRLAESGAGCLDRWPGWMTALAMRVVAVHRAAPIDQRGDLLRLIDAFLNEHPAGVGEERPPRVLRLLAAHSVPVSGSGARRETSRELRHSWPVAEIASVAALADRLELSAGQLAWLADVRSLERTVNREQLRNYRYRALARTAGVPRVIEAPKARLKEIQRWILREILDRVPPHDSAHGFTRGRSAITHAQLHTGQAAVLRLDLKDFFASIAAGRVYAIFRALRYSPAIAHTLTGLTTNVVPVSVWEAIASTTPQRAVQARFWLGRQLATPHLPQGAPTSPALANLAAYRLDRRLSGLARASSLRYSRYADDLTFSGPDRVHRRRRQPELIATEIISAEGFQINESKSAIQSAGGRQTVCGVVVNVHPNIRRTEYDRLRAILHNAAVHGPASQNHAGAVDFEAHLRGRISWVESLNAKRGQKLRELLSEIDWS